MLMPPAIVFKGSTARAILYKSKAVQFYNYIANQAEAGGVSHVSRNLPLPDGSIIKVSSYKEGNYGLRTGSIIIVGSMILEEEYNIQLIIKTTNGIFRAIRKKVDGVDTVVLEPFTKNVGWSFSWTNGKDLACSVDVGTNTVFINSKEFIIPTTNGFIFAAAALSKTTGIVALCKIQTTPGTYSIYRFAKTSEGIVILDLIDTIEHEHINTLIFSKSTSGGIIKLLVLYDNTVLEQRSYTSNPDIPPSQELSRILQSITTLRQTFSGSSYSAQTIFDEYDNDIGRHEVWSGYSAISTRSDDGGRYLGISLADTFKKETICTEFSTNPFTQETTISPGYYNIDRVFLGGTTATSSEESTVSRTDGTDTQRTFKFTFGEDLIFSGTPLSYESTFNSSGEIIKDNSGTSGVITQTHTTHVSAGEITRPSIYFSDEVCTVCTSDTASTTEATRTSIVEAEDFLQSGVLLLNAISDDNGSFIRHRTQGRTVIVNGVEVYTDIIVDESDLPVVLAHSYANPRTTAPAIDITTVTDRLSNENIRPPLGDKYAYTKDLYAVYVPGGYNNSPPPRILFFRKDDKEVNPTLIHTELLPEGQSSGRMALHSGGL